MQSTTSKVTYWQNHINQWQASGLSQKAYCHQHDLKSYNLSYWKNKFDAQKKEDGSHGFIPVTLESTSPASLRSLRLQLSSGHRIEGFSSIEELIVLIRALS